MQGGGDRDEERLWVLKTTAHRGQGVSVVPQQQAITAALTGSAGEDVSAVLLQEYKSAQYMVAGAEVLPEVHLKTSRNW